MSTPDYCNLLIYIYNFIHDCLYHHNLFIIYNLKFYFYNRKFIKIIKMLLISELYQLNFIHFDKYNFKHYLNCKNLISNFDKTNSNMHDSNMDLS